MQNTHCRSPGRYTITLVQPEYPGRPVQITIDKVEAIRQFTADKRKQQR